MFKQSQVTQRMDKDFIKVFEPIVKVQILLGSSRVNIKKGLITPPTIFQKCYTAIWVITMITSLLRLLMLYMARFSDSRKALYIWMMGISSVLVVFSGLVIYARFYDNEANINLYVKMHEIDRLMGRMNRTINIMLHKLYRKVAYSLTTFFAVILILSYVLARNEYGILESVGATYTLATLVLELSCCSCHISFFYTRVHQLNALIRKNIRKEPSIAVLNTRTNSGDSPIKQAEFKENYATDIYFKEIYQGFNLFKQQYRLQVFLFCAVFVGWVLFTFEHGILALQSDYTDKRIFLFDFLFLLSLAFIYLILLLVLSVGSETFMREVRETKHLSILILCRNIDGPSRKKVKNMVKLIEEIPPSFSVYGMWRMDAQLLLDIFHVVTGLILTITQFTFL